MTSENLSTTPSTPQLPTPISKIYPLLFLIFGAAGFLDASYLTAKHYLGGTLECNLLKGCEAVTTSAYSAWFGIPFSLFGALFYLTVLLLTVYYFDKKNLKTLRWLAMISPIGFLASIWFVYLQVFVIGALCEFCILSAITSTLLFAVGATVYLKYFHRAGTGLTSW